MNVYFDKEEAAFILDQPKGWLRKLVREKMEYKNFESRHLEQTEDRFHENKVGSWTPPKDTFGPRLK